MQNTDIDALYQSLVAQLSRQRLIDWTRALIEIPSVNPFDAEPAPGQREQEIAHYYRDQLELLGVTATVREAAPGRPNVWGSLKGGAPGKTLMLSGHLDTVGVEGYSAPFDACERDDRLYGRGSCDMKAALAAYLEVARLLAGVRDQLHGELLITGVADEEYRMLGSKDFGARGPFADYCIIGEPSSLQVCPAHKGQFSLFIRTFGTAVHSSVPSEGVNAIEKMGKVIEAFADYNQQLSQGCRHTLCGHGSFSPGVIRGGDIVSTVPDFCELEVDRRILPNESKADILAEYRRKLDAIAQTDPDFRYEISAPSWDVGA
ncbi:MAG: M20 family metallopeptidase, partial [Pseudomonadales bacterium]